MASEYASGPTRLSQRPLVMPQSVSFGKYYAHGYFPEIFNGLLFSCSARSNMNVHTKFEVRIALLVPEITWGT